MLLIGSFQWLVLLSLLSGCGIVGTSPRITTDTKRPAPMDDSELLKQLIGRSRESVIEKLGDPNYGEYFFDDRTYLMYHAISSVPEDTYFLFIPIGVSEEKYNVRWCLRFELDQNMLVKDYQIRTTCRAGFRCGCRWAFGN